MTKEFESRLSADVLTVPITGGYKLKWPGSLPCLDYATGNPEVGVLDVSLLCDPQILHPTLQSFSTNVCDIHVSIFTKDVCK